MRRRLPILADSISSSTRNSASMSRRREDRGGLREKGQLLDGRKLG
jgi:hypothetical protein